MAEALAIHAVVAGTAGHIDHGKSSLVRALTGIDPDRLKEEKERGLTIDLGFANLRLSDGRRIGLVDVPGHERFVRNMVAGSTALDFAILVVAADDGVMPQTREHVDVLELLGVGRGIVALTKIDLVDDLTATLAEEEVRELLAPTRLAGAAIHRLSSVTGRGIEEFKAALEELARSIAPRPADGPFRMSVQRVFTLPGIGTVVTGIPVSGAVASGQEVEFLPGGRRSRVRALQAYGGKVGRVVAGHSSALSVPDVKHEEIHRGMVAAEPGIFTSGQAVDIDLKLLARTKPIEHRAPIRFHSGTVEVQGLLALLDRDSLAGGEEVVARVLLDEEVSVVPGDRFLLRSQNPPRTIGGGQVLRLLESSRRYRRAAVGEELSDLRSAGASLEGRVLQHLTHAGPAGRTAAELATVLAVEVGEVETALAAMPGIHRHEASGRWFLQEVLDAGVAEVLGGVERMLASRPLAASVQRSSLRTSRTLPPALLDAVVDHLHAAGRVRHTGGRLVFVDRLRPLPAKDRAAVDALATACAEAGFRPPTEAELASVSGLAGEAFAGVLARAVDEATVVRIGDYYYAASRVREAMRTIRDNCLAHGGSLDIPELRDRLDTSRKFLIPLLEHCDAMGLTRLRAGVRVLLPASRLIDELAAGDPA